MLTKTDLSQIGSVVDQKLEPIKKELSQIGQVIDEKLDTKLKPIRRDLRYLRKTVELIVINYDEGDVKLGRRVRKIEQHIGLAS